MLVRSIRVLCLKLAVLFTLFITTSSLGLASCGQDSIPYILSVDLSGRPELYCETPVCFGKSSRQRSTVAPTADYEEDEGKEEESTMSTSLQQYRRRLKKRRFTRSVGGFAECTGELTDAICSGPDEWTGAVAEVNNGTHISLQMECCRYEGLGEAIELKTLVLRPGDRYVGGAIRENGKLAAFDLVKEVRKNVTAFNQVRYVINVYRMHCAQEPKSKGKFKPPLLWLVYIFFQADMFLEDNHDQYVQKVTQLTSRTSYTPTPSTPSMRRFHKLTRPPTESLGNRLDHDVISRRRHPPMRNSYYRSSNFGGRMTRRQQARFPPYNRRRQFYRPIVDDYDEYYDVEPMSYRRPVYRKPKLKITDDQLWPLSYPASSTVKSNTRKQRPRQYNGGAYETENAVSFRPEDEYQVQESQYSPAPSPPVPVPTESQLITYPQSNNYVTLLPSVGVQGYAAANSYVPPPPPQPALVPSYPVAGSAVGTNYETYQTNQQQQQQQSVSLAGSSDCSTPCASSSSYSSCAPTTCSAPTCTPSCCCSSGGMNALFSGLQCFSGDMTVKTPTGEKEWMN
uniref:Uncharacterized protein n=1 Tax=Ditylenchus dipsaci TaxID=166011 RepID=A0A915DAH1_9BILA